jgi:hypothetical protein
VTAGDNGATSVTSNTTSVCTVTSGTVNYVGLGTCSLTASVAATTDYTAASGSAQTFSVGQATPTVSISNLPASGTYGGSFTPTYSVTAGDNGATSVTSNTTSVCTVTSGTVNYVGLGTCSLTAHVAATTDFVAGTGSAQTFSVGQATQAITFTSTAPTNATVGGANYTASATASSGLTPVTFAGTSGVCTASGTNGVTITFVGAGTCTVTASQAGNTDYSSASNTQSFTVFTPLTPTSLSLQNNGGTLGEPSAGDVITMTWPRALQVSSLCSTWTNNNANQTLTTTVDLSKASTNADGFVSIPATPCSGSTAFNLGTLDTGATFISGSGSRTVAFSSSTISYNATTFTETITLGTKGTGTLTQDTGNVTATYTPLASIKDTNAIAASGSVSTGSVEQWAAGPATQLVFTQQPTNSGVGSTITPAVQVTEEDAYGNVETGDNATQVTVAIGTNPSGGTLSGTLTETVSAGVATFSNLSINKGGTGYTLTAASTGLTGATSDAFNVALQYSGSSSTSIPTGGLYYAINTLSSVGSGTSTANGFKPGVAETLTSFTFTIDSTSGTTHTATVGLITGSSWSATALTCSIPANSGTSCTVTANVSVSATQSLNVFAVGNGNHSGSWVTTYTQP